MTEDEITRLFARIFAVLICLGALLLNGAALWLVGLALLSAMNGQETPAALFVIMFVGAGFIGEAFIVAAVAEAK